MTTKAKTCWCGKPATRECHIAVTFCCGQPLCDEHECHRVGFGLTGRGKHSESGFRQYQDWMARKYP